MMAKLVLIRHAQASLRSSNYDQLSPVGLQQAEILGAYYKSISLFPDKVVCGSLQRQIKTTQLLSQAISRVGDLHIEIDERWNEFDFKTLLKIYISEHHDKPLMFSPDTEPKVFFGLLKKAMIAWSNGNIDNGNIESWDSFKERVVSGLIDVTENSSKDDVIFVTSSGGAISMALQYILDLSTDKMIDLNFQIKNTSFSFIDIKKNRLVLDSFNQIPHLETRTYRDLITYA